MEVLKLEPFGVEIKALDLREQRTAKQSAQLLDLFNQHYLLVVRGQELSDDDHLRVFHDLFPGEDLGDGVGGSEISYVSNVRPDGLFGDGGLTFHSDYSFTTDPTRIISLYGYDVQPGSASTDFADGESALSALPDDLREYLQDKSVVCATDLMSVLAHVPSYNLPGREDLSGRSHEDIVRASWPAIRTHDRTGRPYLFVNEQHAHHLQGVALAEGREVLERVCGYLYADSNIYRHEWKQGDLVLWDNLVLAHGRRATTAETARRTMRRVRAGGATLPRMVALSQRGLDETDAGAYDGELAGLDQMRLAIGTRVRAARIAGDLTQVELSEAIGCEVSSLQMVEVGIRLPALPQLLAISGVLRVDPSLFVEGLALGTA
jgi:alpha-ketoglutarate-dependent taurine dioxygenase